MSVEKILINKCIQCDYSIGIKSKRCRKCSSKWRFPKYRKMENTLIKCKNCKNLCKKYRCGFKRPRKFCSSKCSFIWHKKNSKIGNKNIFWRGNNVSYLTKHQWIHRHYGKANKCENKYCIKKCKKYEWSNISGKYSRNRNDYRRLCVSCHRRIDYKKRYGNKCKKGHYLDYENTYIFPDGKRRCRICIRLTRNKWTAKKRLSNGYSTKCEKK